MDSAKKPLLLIFTRNPEPGRCKTRLAATLGERAALEIYVLLLKHTAEISKPLTVDKRVCYSDTILENDLWDPSHFQKVLQRGEDLGARMENAFHDGFTQGYTDIIIIGSDMYDLQTGDLEKAFRALEMSDYIIGPAIDGGYYLLGMKVPTPRVFRNKTWGTDTVLSDTLANLKGRSVYLLPEKNDIDVYEDIVDIPAFRPFLKHKE